MFASVPTNQIDILIFFLVVFASCLSRAGLRQCSRRADETDARCLGETVRPETRQSGLPDLHQVSYLA